MRVFVRNVYSHETDLQVVYVYLFVAALNALHFGYPALRHKTTLSFRTSCHVSTVLSTLAQPWLQPCA